MLEEGGGALGVLLDQVHGPVGVAAQHFIRQPVLGIGGDADRGGGENLLPVDDARLLQRVGDCEDGRFEIVAAIDVLQQQHEFVAADAREHVLVAKQAPDSEAGLDQERVANRMAVEIVDLLEVVDVYDGNGEMNVRPADQFFDPLLKLVAVWQAGQFVEIGAPREFLFDQLPFCDVERRGDAQALVADQDRFLRGQQGAGTGVAEKTPFAGDGLVRFEDRKVRTAGFANLACRGFDRRGVAGDARRLVREQGASVLRAHGHPNRQLVKDFVEQAEFAPRLALQAQRAFERVAEIVDFRGLRVRIFRPRGRISSRLVDLRHGPLADDFRTALRSWRLVVAGEDRLKP